MPSSSHVCLPTGSGDSKHPPRKTSPPFTHHQEYPIWVSNYYPYSKLAYTQSQNVPHLTTTDTCKLREPRRHFPTLSWYICSFLFGASCTEDYCKLDLPLRRRFSKMSTSWSTCCFCLSTLQHHIFDLILSLLYDVSLTNGPTDNSDRRSWEF